MASDRGKQDRAKSLSPSRRRFVKSAVAGMGALLLRGTAQAKPLFETPVATNRLRPPGAVPEEIFPAKCIRCGRCAEVCPYKSIVPLDISSGIFAGTPLIDVVSVPCYLCMKCVEVCPTGTLRRVSQKDVRMGVAVLDRRSCSTWKEDGMMLCRTCYNVCPFKESAIKLDQLRPVVVADLCTGCGLCVHGCPVTLEDGRKAINVEPIYATEPVMW